MELNPRFLQIQGNVKTTDLTASNLADAIDTGDLDDIVEPLLDNYEKWIDWKENTIGNIPIQYHKRAKSNLDKAKASLLMIELWKFINAT